MVLSPYRTRLHDEGVDPSEGNATLTEEVLLLLLILGVSAGPVLSAMLFGMGSPIEVGIGTVLGACALVALFREVSAHRAQAVSHHISED